MKEKSWVTLLIWTSRPWTREKNGLCKWILNSANSFRICANRSYKDILLWQGRAGRPDKRRWNTAGQKIIFENVFSVRGTTTGARPSISKNMRERRLKWSDGAFGQETINSVNDSVSLLCATNNLNIRCVIGLPNDPREVGKFFFFYDSTTTCWLIPMRRIIIGFLEIQIKFSKKKKWF